MARPKKKRTCPRCKGEGVVWNPNYPDGNELLTCDLCNGKGKVLVKV